MSLFNKIALADKRDAQSLDIFIPQTVTAPVAADMALLIKRKRNERLFEAVRRLAGLVEYVGKGGMCPKCGKKTPLYDRRNERIWRHLDCCGYQMYIRCGVPRVTCGKHRVKTMQTPWGCGRSGSTKGFEKFAVGALLAAKNRSKTGDLLQISWDEIGWIMSRAVRLSYWRHRVTNGFAEGMNGIIQGDKDCGSRVSEF